jgi:hypothetical protein
VSVSINGVTANGVTAINAACVRGFSKSV